MSTRKFTGGGSAGNWSDPANWKGGLVPGTADTAQVFGGPNQTFGAPIAVNNLMVIGGETLTFTGAVSTAGIGNCQGVMVCVGSTIVFAPGSSLSDGGVLQVGLDQVGGFIARGTSAQATSIVSGTTFIGKLNQGVGTMTIDGASWTASKSVLVGDAGQGTLNATNGATITVDDNFVIGLHAGASGQATLSGNATLTVDGKASIGAVDAGVTGGTGTLTVDAGSVFDAKGLMLVCSGSTVDLAGGTISAGDTTSGLVVRAGGAVTGFGTLATRTGGWVDDSGRIEANGGTMQINANVVGTGTLQVDANSTVAITGAIVLAPTLTFAGSDATLALAHGAFVKAQITGFAAGDQITMAGIDHAAWNSNTDILTLSNAGHTVDRLHLGGSYAGDVFSVTQSNGVGVVTLHAGA